MTDIVEALLKVQKEIKNPPTTAENPFAHSKYAALPDILNQVRPLLTKQGIILVQNTGSCQDGRLFVQTRLLFSNGNGTETIESDKLILTPDEKRISGVQAVGSAITYGRRYQLLALLGIAGEGEDDDGEGRTTNNRNGKESEKSQTSNNKQNNAPKTSKTSKTSKKPKTGKKQPKTAQKNGEPETSSVIEGNTKRLKELSKKNPELKKVLDNLNQAGLEFHDVNIMAEAEDMNRKKTLTDGEYNKVMVALGKAPG